MSNALNHVTWRTLLQFVAFSLVIYYSIVGWIYYREELEPYLTGILKRLTLNVVYRRQAMVYDEEDVTVLTNAAEDIGS